MDDNNIYNNKNNNQDAFEQAARQQAAMQEEQAQLRGQPPVWETQAPPVNNQWEAQPAASQEPQQPIHQTERPPVYEPEQRTPYQVPVRDSREVQPPCQTQSSVPPQEGGFRESPYQSSASQQTPASQQWQSQQAPKPPKKKKGQRIAIAFGGVAAAALLFGLFRALSNVYTGFSFLASLNIPSSVYNMLPYVISLIVLAFTSQKSRAPKAEGIPYDKGLR